jgi:putative redox protein
MRSERIKFNNKEGIQLSARLDFPVDQKPLAFAIFAHCFTCNKNFHAVKNISKGLTSNGIAVLLFDFTGLGQSEGEFESTTFTTNIQDLFAASDFLSENYEAPKIIIGHSLGGAAALFAAQQLENIKAAVCIAAPFNPYHVTNLLADDLEKIKKEGKAKVNIGGRSFTIGQSFIDDLDDHKPEKAAKDLRKALLIMHSPQDNVVSIENAAKIYQAAMHPKSFISLDGADHLMQEESDSIYAGSMIAHWVRKYLVSEIAEDEERLESDFKVAVQTSNESLSTEIKAGKHHLVADEPKDVGGDDSGPSPYDLLSAALGACTSMTVQMYAKQKEWDLEEATVHINHEKKHNEDALKKGKKSAKLDHFTRKVELKGNLTQEQRERLLEIANRCPVKRTLSSDIQINSELIE